MGFLPFLLGRPDTNYLLLGCSSLIEMQNKSTPPFQNSGMQVNVLIYANEEELQFQIYRRSSLYSLSLRRYIKRMACFMNNGPYNPDGGFL